MKTEGGGRFCQIRQQHRRYGEGSLKDRVESKRIQPMSKLHKSVQTWTSEEEIRLTSRIFKIMGPHVAVLEVCASCSSCKRLLAL